MKSAAFVSSWVQSQRTPLRPAHKPLCPTAPSMVLVSHEKVEVLSNSKDTEVAKYKLEIEIPGLFSKDKRRQTIQALKGQANFPGFRKGTIPPYVMKDLDEFVLRDSTSNLIEEALQELELVKVDGDEGEPDMDFDGLVGGFKSGENFTFSCEIQTKRVVTEVPVGSLEDLITTDVELESFDAFKDPAEGASTEEAATA